MGLDLIRISRSIPACELSGQRMTRRDLLDTEPSITRFDSLNFFFARQSRGDAL
jgi:hypothetical protein